MHLPAFRDRRRGGLAGKTKRPQQKGGRGGCRAAQREERYRKTRPSAASLPPPRTATAAGRRGGSCILGGRREQLTNWTRSPRCSVASVAMSYSTYSASPCLLARNRAVMTTPPPPPAQERPVVVPVAAHPQVRVPHAQASSIPSLVIRPVRKHRRQGSCPRSQMLPLGPPPYADLVSACCLTQTRQSLGSGPGPRPPPRAPYIARRGRRA